jgi:cytochrome c551/c552
MLRSALKPAAFFILAAMPPVASAVDSTLELATARGCFICHTVSVDQQQGKPLAPSYQEVAERYRGRADAGDYLASRVLQGTAHSEQNWEDAISMRFMPPNVNLSPDEAGLLVGWILDLPTDEALHRRMVEHESMLILSTTSGCMTCHRMEHEADARLMPLAPALRDIADRYRGIPDAAEQLVRSILSGTRGAEKRWQEVNMEFMPPNVALSRDNAERLAAWILGLQPLNGN